MSLTCVVCVCTLTFSARKHVLFTKTSIEAYEKSRRNCRKALVNDPLLVEASAVNSVQEQEENSDLIFVARAVRTRGLKGEVVADLLTDFPQRFDDAKELIAVDARGTRTTLQLERHWFQQGRVILKFKGYDRIETAEKLVPCDLGVPETEAVELDENEYYDWQLEGCQVKTVTGESIGRVGEVLHTGGVPILMVIGADEREHLIPLAETICIEVDIDGKLIRVDPPEGLLEL